MNHGVPKLIVLHVSWMSSAAISARRCNVELLRELPRSSLGILVKVKKELSLGFSAQQSSQCWTKHPPGNLVPEWVSSRLPGAYLCSICVVTVNMVMFCFLHRVPVSWLHAFVHAGQGTQSWGEKAMVVQPIDLVGEERC